MSDNASVLALLPGEGSTRFAVTLDGAPVQQGEAPIDRSASGGVSARRRSLDEALERANVSRLGLRAIVAPAGFLRPSPGGTYEVTPALLADAAAASERWGVPDPSNDGAALAAALAEGTPARVWVCDPSATAEMGEGTRLTGVPDIARPPVCEALALRAAARDAAARIRKPLDECSIVAAFLDEVLSLAAVRGTTIADACDSRAGTAPFGARSSGPLPAAALLALVKGAGLGVDEIERRLSTGAGLAAYAGAPDLAAVAERVTRGDASARLALDAFCRGIAREIGALATNFGGRADAVVLTGSFTRSPHVLGWIQERVRSIGPVVVLPGDRRLQALADAALRVLRGEETARTYGATPSL